MARKNGATETERKRGATGFVRAAACVAAVTRAAGAARGFAERKLLTRWPEIAGPELAALCQPLEISHRRGQGLGGTLVLAVEGAAAPEVTHMGPRLIERVNQAFGYAAVSRLRVTQMRPLAPPATPAPPPPRIDRVTPDAISGVADEGLRAALALLATNIRTKAAKAAADRSR